MSKHLEYDRDGDVITFSPEDKVAIAEEISLIDAELAGPCADAMRTELTRQRRQMTAELAAGHFLPMIEED